MDYLETKFEITLQEVEENVFKKDESIQEAIYCLLKEKTCKAASMRRN